MTRLAVFVVIAVATLALGAGLYGTVGVSDTDADRGVTIEVVEQADGLIGIDTGDARNRVYTDGNATRIATITNRIDREFWIHESVSGPDGSSGSYSLRSGDSTDIFVHVDCTESTTETYVIELVAETTAGSDLRIESTTTVTVHCQ